MSGVLREKTWRDRRLPIVSVAFFILFLLYIWHWVNPALIYYWPTNNFPCFWRGVAFFKGRLAYPGGPIEYVSAFLSQLYCVPLVGALIITLVAILLCLAAKSLFAALGGIRVPALHFVPAVLLLMLCNRYGHYLTAGLGLLTALLFASIYVKVRVNNRVLRLVTFLVLSAVLYFLAGGAYLTCAVLCGIFEILTARRFLLGLCLLLLAVMVPYAVGTHIYQLTAVDSFARLLPYHPDSDARAPLLALSLFLFFPIVGLGVAGWHRFLTKEAQATESAMSPRTASASERSWKSRLRQVLQSPALLILAVVPAWLSSDGDLRTAYRIEYCARHRMWQQLLREAKRLHTSRWDTFVNWDINRALYHTGQLPHRMFAYPQPLRGPILPAYHVGLNIPPRWMQASDVRYEFGDINASERMACEALQMIGARPWVLLRLAEINIVKGETEATHVFLNALRKDLVHKSLAEDYMRRLEADPLLSEDPQFSRTRSVMLKKDYHLPLAARPPSLEEDLLQSIEANRRNKMAFECLMGVYLLYRHLDKVVLNMERLDDFDYPGIPRHYEEAILIYTAVTGKRVDLGGRRVSPEAVQRFRDFNERLAYSDAGSKQAAADALAGDYGDTYFFYYLLGPQ